MYLERRRPGGVRWARGVRRGVGAGRDPEGRTLGGRARAAAAHSGALAGDQRVFRSLVEEAGALWASDVHELLELAKALAVRRPRAASTREASGAVRGR